MAEFVTLMDPINVGQIVSTVDVSLSNFDQYVALLICITGFVLGWKRVAPGLILYVAYDLSKYGWVSRNGGPYVFEMPELSNTLLEVLCLVACWSFVRWVWNKIRSLRKIKSQTI